MSRDVALTSLQLVGFVDEVSNQEIRSTMDDGKTMFFPDFSLLVISIKFVPKSHKFCGENTRDMLQCFFGAFATSFFSACFVILHASF